MRGAQKRLTPGSWNKYTVQQKFYPSYWNARNHPLMLTLVENWVVKAREAASQLKKEHSWVQDS